MTSLPLEEVTPFLNFKTSLTLSLNSWRQEIMNAHLFKFSLMLKLDEFIKSNEGLLDLPNSFNNWFNYFLDYLGYTVEDEE